ncbi:DUF3426 domain-containing protein [Undibacterium sp. SXout7W]|uniref:DUF3426 domain-containing protein n=1 Tax=Undibacterium sp. SXout7W TaxID=3413049 RepID=UPI003BEF700E
MALATRCPHCQTTFKVANDQLKLHAGLVRCGSCNQTFNGIEHLIPLENLSAPAPVAQPVTVSTPAATIAKTAAKTAAATIATTDATTDTVVAEASVATAVSATENPPVASELRDQQASSVIADTTAEIVKDTATNASTETSAQSATTPQPRALKIVKPVTAESALPAEDSTSVISSSSLDFDLGDLGAQPLSDEATLAQVELETRAALMNQPTVDWSVSDGDAVDAMPFAAHTANEPSLGDIRSEKLDASPASPLAPETDNREPYISDIGDHTTTGAAVTADQDSISDIVSDSANTATGDIGSQPAQSDDAADEEEHLPAFVVQAEKNKGRHRVTRIVMLVLSLLLLPLLLAQTVYLMRVQIAARFPDAKPLLVQACQAIHCQIGLPMQIDQISMESNELQSIAPEKNLFLLAVQLQNSSSTVQTWPVVELTLNDAKDKPVLQRAFAPADYLADPTDISKGFASGTEQNIKLYFELPKLKAAGYHVGYFYP